MKANPLCWYWPTELPARDEVKRRFLEQAAGAGRTPEQAEVLWKLECAADALVGDDDGALARWQDGRCAICGKTRDLVCDHDHATGLVRGWLCHSCNITEGTNQEPDTIFARYRERPPAAILGIAIRYLNPVTGEDATPPPAGATNWADKWVDAASEGIL
ncbi:endonuclease VII domain-containing protein [Streptomyces sp. LRE541]|uniref:endonuclease domain-containing protein n=1 Tax=Streptomyces sp. LRE541 TaxID=2931983 RepID=UPI00200CA629|nr:endonuclease domain-containing protein [Streptomyces sp. LRE541]UPZ27599.1 endonuclease VII domain-containing protein [Streptomyces sp. LRE541]